MDPHGPAMRIGELSHRTGVSVATLRAWEHRYRLLHPSRTSGGQRLYSADDEARVRAVQLLTADGSSVGAAARWVVEEDRASKDEPPSELSRSDATIGGGRRGTVSAGTVAVGAPPVARTTVSDDELRQLERVHATTRAMVHASTPSDVVAALSAYVRSVGGSVVDAEIDPAVLPVDLSFGLGPPQLPRAEPMSVARLHLERSLPALVDDARCLISLLRIRSNEE